jgi:hypothetical protein
MDSRVVGLCWQQASWVANRPCIVNTAVSVPIVAFGDVSGCQSVNLAVAGQNLDGANIACQSFE